MNNRPSIFTAIIALLMAVILLLVFRKCERQAELQMKEPIRAEIALQNIITMDSIARLNYQRDTAMLAAENSALKRELSNLKGKLSTQTAKAQHSAQEYAKTPTLSTCHEALKDCHEESETKSEYIAVQDRLLSAADSSQRLDRKEIARVYWVADSLARGWQKANRDLRKDRSKNWALTIQAGYGIGHKGGQPAISFGISRILYRF